LLTFLGKAKKVSGSRATPDQQTSSTDIRNFSK
jgi:hypothetical protein